MFERRTVFIVGAGASREINFPMGAELTGIIANKVRIAFSNGRDHVSGDIRVIGAIRHQLNQKGERDGNHTTAQEEILRQAWPKQFQSTIICMLTQRTKPSLG
ncbi:hypothetical protein [Rhizobium sophoriradicis]|uniref:hypothetical protein n=1 Tax=Rhizobium sophoriradicis TaxID=1535245 RepID=UPI001FDEF916|nr:hypothetical protein [Rhizobium sophoriradicis]